MLETFNIKNAKKLTMWVSARSWISWQSYPFPLSSCDFLCLPVDCRVSSRECLSLFFMFSLFSRSRRFETVRFGLLTNNETRRRELFRLTKTKNALQPRVSSTNSQIRTRFFLELHKKTAGYLLISN